MEGRGAAERIAPASGGQRRLWFLDRLAPGVYTHHEAFRLRGAFDNVRLEAALTTLCQRHESLRTTFRSEPAGLLQVVGFPSAVDVEVAEVADLAEFLAEEGRRPFDLGNGPLWRASCGRISEDEHVLVLGLHHIISDGWSVGIILEELSHLYALESDTLPPLPTSFAAWAEPDIAEAVEPEDIEWWEDALLGAPPVIDLPADRTRPPVQTFPARSASLDLAVPTVLALDDWARARRSTRFMAVVAASTAVLARWSGQEDLVIGVPVAARDAADIERVVGFFAQTLVVRVDVGGHPTWDELLDRTRSSFLGALSHGSVPFETLVDRLTAHRDPALTPLFNVAVALQDAPRSRLHLQDLDVEALEFPSSTVPFDLMVQFHPQANGGLRITVEANADLFDQRTVDRLARHLRRAIEAVPKSAGAPVSSLDLLEPGEMEQLIALSATAPPPEPEATWPQLFARSVAAHPDASAVDESGVVTTYAELRRRSDEVGCALAAKGIGRGALVALAMARSTEFVATLIGIMKAGAAFLPLNPCDPEARIARILEDATPDLVIDYPMTATSEVRTDSAGLAAGSIEPDDLAYVIYTSGSTGEPKGVQTRQLGLANLAAAQLGLLEVGTGDRVLSWFSPTFDAFLFELNYGLLTGATLVVATPEDLAPGPPLTATLEREAVTVLCATPSVLAVTHPPAGPLPRIVAACAEPCPPSVIRRWAGVDRQVLNCYGPTETSCCTNVGRCTPDDRRPNVGPPLAGVREYVVDFSGRLAPIGLPGELYIGGAAVGAGYRGLEELTAQRFVADPVLPGGTAYRTGDRARMLTDGSIEILGRLDDQVKVRGHRVEPAEVATTLRSHPDVADVVVVPRQTAAAGTTELTAYVVPGAPRDISDVALREWARQRVPDYLVPAHVVFVDRLPLLASGKIDRRSLPDPSPTFDSEQWTPSTPTEREVADVWAGVLGREVAGAQGFFDSGGNSLLVVTLAEELERRLGVHFELAELFRFTTVAQQSALADERSGRTDDGGIAGYEL